MMSQRRSSLSDCVFNNRAIVAQDATIDDVWTQCSLSLKFDPARSRGMISLRLRAKFEESDGTQDILLQLSPDIVQRINIYDDSERIPPCIAQHFRQNTALTADRVIILSLAASAPGRLVVPQDATILTPIRAHQAQIRNFGRLCRATQLLLYIPSSNLSQTRRLALEEFTDRIHARGLGPVHTDLRRFQRGQGSSEATPEIFHVPESPPSYKPEKERVTAKRAREESPVGETDAAQKRLPSEFRAANYDPPTYIANSDSDTDFSRLLSPLQSSHTAKSPHPGAAQPTAATRDTPLGKLLQETLNAELNATLQGLLREMLPGVLQETLPELVRGCLRGLLPGALNDLIFTASPSSQESEKSSPELFFDSVIESVVVRHLPQVVRDYIELEDPLETYMGAADVEVSEASYNAVLEIKEAKDESLAEIKQAEIDVVERLTGVDWNVIGKEIMGLTPSQQSYSQQPHGGAATAAVWQDALDHEGGREELEAQEPREHPLMEDRIWTSEPQGSNRLLPRTSFGYGSQATTADETEGGKPGQPSSESLRSRSKLFHASRNAIQENSRTSSPDQQALGNDHSEQATEIGKEIGFEVVSRKNSTNNIDIDEVHRDEREDTGKNEGGSGTRNGELFRMAWTDSWMYATTEPDTESGPSKAG